MPWLSLAASFTLSLLLVPLVRAASFRLGKVAQPRPDRWHSQPTPTLGGVGMFAAFGLVVLAAGLFGSDAISQNWPLLAGSALMFVLGLVDDFKAISPPAKLLGQIVAAALVIFFGRVIDFFPWEFANMILTFFWLVGITNAINLLDNMDGLAGGISLIAAGFLAYFFWRSGNEGLLLLTLALAGGIAGFLVFNFPPARIFMGDSGSLFLGFTLAALAVSHRPRASDVFTVMGVPILLFLLPILDTALVTVTRILRGQSPAQGGKDHTSHRLIAFGLSEKQAVLALYAIGLVSGITGSILEALDYDLSLVLIPILIIALSLLTAYLGRMKVVSTVRPVSTNLTRLMGDLTYRRRIFEMVLDFFLIGLSYYLAFWTRYSFRLSSAQMDLILNSVPLALAAAYLAFFLAGVYRGLWRYVGVEDLVRYGQAALGSVVLTAVPLWLLGRIGPYSPVVFFLFGVFLFLGLAASRSSFRILDRVYYGEPQSRSERCNVLIYGAEDAGEIALRWILRNPNLGYNPVGFLDEDPHKWGRLIHGINVLGGSQQLERILLQKPAQGLIVTVPVLDGDIQARQLVQSCRQKGLWVRLLRLDFELFED